MKNLKVEASKYSPGISFNAETGILEVSGNSGTYILEEYEKSSEYLYNMVNWLEIYLRNPLPRTTFICKLRSFDTATSKYLVAIFRLLETIEKPNTVDIFWQLGKDDSDILEYIENVNEILKKVHIVVIE